MILSKVMSTIVFNDVMMTSSKSLYSVDTIYDLDSAHLCIYHIPNKIPVANTYMDCKVMAILDRAEA